MVNKLDYWLTYTTFIIYSEDIFREIKSDDNFGMKASHLLNCLRETHHNNTKYNGSQENRYGQQLANVALSLDYPMEPHE